MYRKRALNYLNECRGNNSQVDNHVLVARGGHKTQTRQNGCLKLASTDWLCICAEVRVLPSFVDLSTADPRIGSRLAKSGVAVTLLLQPLMSMKL